MMPMLRVKRVISLPCDLSSDAKHRGKCAHWVEAPAQAKHKLVEVDGQMLLTHTVVCTQKPRFEVREDQVATCFFRLPFT